MYLRLACALKARTFLRTIVWRTALLYPRTRASRGASRNAERRRRRTLGTGGRAPKRESGFPGHSASAIMGAEGGRAGTDGDRVAAAPRAPSVAGCRPGGGAIGVSRPRTPRAPPTTRGEEDRRLRSVRAFLPLSRRGGREGAAPGPAATLTALFGRALRIGGMTRSLISEGKRPSRRSSLILGRYALHSLGISLLTRRVWGSMRRGV